MSEDKSSNQRATTQQLLAERIARIIRATRDGQNPFIGLGFLMEIQAALIGPTVETTSVNCREAGAGRGKCDMCAAGEYEKCRYVVRPARKPDESPALPTSKDVLTRVREAAHALGNDPPNGITTMQALTALHDAIAEIERLQKDRNECLEAFHILFRIFPESK